MTANETQFDEKLVRVLNEINMEGIHNAARGFSGLLGQTLTVLEPTVRVVPLQDIPNLSGGPECEAIGVYLRAEGDLSAQIMMIIPYQKALELVDLLMGEPAGTTKNLGSLERSALAEVGNQTGTFFLNSLASILKVSVRPSPPAVMVDMVGAILDIVVATCGGITDQVLLMQAELMNGDNSVATDFWVIPDIETLKKISAGI